MAPDVVVKVCILSTQEAETKGWLQIRGQRGLHSECKSGLNYIARPCLKKQKDTKYSYHPERFPCSPTQSLSHCPSNADQLFVIIGYLAFSSILNKWNCKYIHAFISVFFYLT